MRAPTMPYTLIPTRPAGAAAAFMAAACKEDPETLFLEVVPPSRGELLEGGVEPGELLAVSCALDAEPGDWIVCWVEDSPRTQVLVAVGDGMSFSPVSGFPPPPPGAAIRGVVVARLRRDLPPSHR